VKLSACPVVQARFRASVNMTPKEIRAWARNPVARCASFPETRARLPALATLKGKPAAKWTEKDCRFAKRVLSFNARMQGMVKKWGCGSTKAVVSLRNWGRSAPGCVVPLACKRSLR